LATSTIGVPKPRKEDLVIDDEDSDEYKYRKYRENKANKCKLVLFSKSPDSVWALQGLEDKDEY
jgi:hypothetical protein